MTQDERRKYIIDLLKIDGQVRVSQLSRDLNTSEVTIRNDLAELEKDALLERVHGARFRPSKIITRSVIRNVWNSASSKKFRWPVWRPISCATATA